MSDNEDANLRDFTTLDFCLLCFPLGLLILFVWAFSLFLDFFLREANLVSSSLPAELTEALSLHLRAALTAGIGALTLFFVVYFLSPRPRHSSLATGIWTVAEFMRACCGHSRGREDPTFLNEILPQYPARKTLKESLRVGVTDQDKSKAFHDIFQLDTREDEGYYKLCLEKTFGYVPDKFEAVPMFSETAKSTLFETLNSPEDILKELAKNAQFWDKADVTECHKHGGGFAKTNDVSVEDIDIKISGYKDKISGYRDGILDEAKRILWLSKMVHVDIQFCPLYPVLVCLLLLVLPESTVFAVGDALLRKAKEDSRTRSPDRAPLLCLTVDEHNKLIEQTKEMLVAAGGVDKEGDSLSKDVATWIFRGLLPIMHYTHIQSIVIPSFLNEGMKVFQRYMVSQSLRASPKKWRGPFDILIRSRKTGFNSMSPRTPVFEELEDVPVIYRPRVDFESKCLPILAYEKLWAIFPSHLLMLNPKLLYSSANHGFNYRTMCTADKEADKYRQNEDATRILVMVVNNLTVGLILPFFSQGQFSRDITEFGCIFTVNESLELTVKELSKVTYSSTPEDGIMIMSSKPNIAMSIDADLNQLGYSGDSSPPLFEDGQIMNIELMLLVEP